jgi:glucosamine 6-phosphate synthetase-like amidotransferase/phosphosugar isomerase protein
MPLDMVGEMFKQMEARGTDSSGIYWERKVDHKMVRRAFKMPGKASDLWKLVQSPATDIAKEDKELPLNYALDGTERLVMLHTRTGTKGSPKQHDNNMPIFSKNFVLIHNGVVQASRLPDYPYKGEVDSEEILARLETLGLKNAIEGVSGSMAIASKRFDEDSLWIYRHSNPIELVYLSDLGLLFGCSKSEYVPYDYDADDMAATLFKSVAVSIVAVPEHSAFKISLIKKEISKVFEAKPPVENRITTLTMLKEWPQATQPVIKETIYE